MQFQPFTSGGYVLHKVLIGNLKYSAWFNRAGQYIDAERIDSRGRSYPVRTDSTAHQALQQIGRRYQHIPVMPM